MGRYATMQAFSFSLNDCYKSILSEIFANNNVVTFLSGGMAGASALVITYPLDFCQTRLVADVGAGKYMTCHFITKQVTYNVIRPCNKPIINNFHFIQNICMHFRWKKCKGEARISQLYGLHPYSLLRGRNQRLVPWSLRCSDRHSLVPLYVLQFLRDIKAVHAGKRTLQRLREIATLDSIRCSTGSFQFTHEKKCYRLIDRNNPFRFPNISSRYGVEEGHARFRKTIVSKKVPKCKACTKEDLFVGWYQRILPCKTLD